MGGTCSRLIFCQDHVLVELSPSLLIVHYLAVLRDGPPWQVERLSPHWELGVLGSCPHVFPAWGSFLTLEVPAEIRQDQRRVVVLQAFHVAVLKHQHCFLDPIFLYGWNVRRQGQVH